MYLYGMVWYGDGVKYVKDEWRSVLYRLLRIVRIFPTFGLLIWIRYMYSTSLPLALMK
jgi:hypothetical protein